MTGHARTNTRTDVETEPDSVIAVIIGRAGSKGLPGKNALPLCGRPMICHTIDAACAARTVGRVVVSTDGDAIANAAEAADVRVIRRPPALADDTAAVDATVRHAIEAIGAEPVVVILYANVPVRPDGLVDRAVHELLSTGADSVQSYADVGKHHPYWMITLDAESRVAPFHANAVDRRQDLPELLLPDGGVIAVTRESLFRGDASHPHAFLGENRRGIRTQPGAVIDIDGPSDLERAAVRLANARVATLTRETIP